MGYIKHETVIVTFNVYALEKEWMPDVPAFLDTMPVGLRSLVLGPVRSLVNGYVTYVFTTDGSKDGWPDSDEAADWRRRFADLFSFQYDDGSTPFDVVELSYGDDFRYDWEQPQAAYAHPTRDF